MSQSVYLPDEAATLRFGEALAAQLASGDIVCLEGPLGAGKTTMMQGIVRALGGDERQVHSPTFALVHSYQDTKIPIFHCDFYRLSEGTELEDLGGLEFFADPAIYCVEWSERITALLPLLSNRVFRVKITVLDAGRSADLFHEN